MKQLYLVRHAKSSWKENTLSDFERPLNERGNRDKVAMGKRLAAQEVKPDIIVSSSAKRTRQTTVSLAKEIGYDTSKIEYQDSLYHASVSAMLQAINNIENGNEIAMLVGHNPGISMLCDYLSNYAVDFPTLGIAKIAFDLENWNEISKETGTLEWFDFPKNTANN